MQPQQQQQQQRGMDSAFDLCLPYNKWYLELNCFVSAWPHHHRALKFITLLNYRKIEQFTLVCTFRCYS